MKKFSALLCVILVTVVLSACQTFYNDSTENYPRNNPSTTTVYLQIKQLPTNSTVDAELTKWRSEILTTNAAITDETAIKISDVQFRFDEDNEVAYTVDLTIHNLPDATVKKSVRPFQITYTQTIFNPISLLPDSETFSYVVLFNSERRHSSANTDERITTEDGNYVYFWTTAEPLEFTDVYPNRPLYYLIILAGAGLVGGLVYLVSRYYDCKKLKNQL